MARKRHLNWEFHHSNFVVKEPQQLIQSHPIIKGMHYNTSPDYLWSSLIHFNVLLEQAMGLDVSLISAIKDPIEYKLHLIKTYSNEINKITYTLFNLASSEN